MRPNDDQVAPSRLDITIARDQMIRSVLAPDPALVTVATADEHRRAHDILWNILSISERSRGILNDARFTSTPQSIRFDQIKVPTLVISLQDDRYGTITPARHIAAQVPGARLVTYASGGHIFAGHDVEQFAEVDLFLREH